MTRESLGQVRIYRYICDQCRLTTEHRIKGSRQVTLPEGWGHVKVSIDNGQTGGNVEGDVCSPTCAGDFVQRAVADDAQAEAT